VCEKWKEVAVKGEKFLVNGKSACQWERVQVREKKCC